MAKLTIDGQEVVARDGATIIEAAHEAGIVIPHYCYHPKLSIAGNCRMCLVEIAGRPKLEISCNTQVANDMQVQTNSPKVVEARCGVLEFLLINHPLDCPVCDQAGECGLQDYYMQHGLYHSRFQEEKVHGRKVVELGPDVVFDAERCILCSRCVRFCQEISKTNELGFFFRGDQAEIGTFPGQRLDNRYAGNTVDICPVGALTSKDFRFKIRVWFLRQTPSVCPGCARGCNITIHHHNDHVYRLKPRRNDAVNETWMCDEGRFGYRAINEQRLLYPLLRQGGTLQRTSWPEALRRVTTLIDEHGHQAVGVLVAPQGTNEDCYLLARLLREVLGTPHVALYPGIPGYADDLLMQADKNPNSRGAVDMGLPAPTTQPTALQQAIAAGTVKVLYAIGTDLAAAFGVQALPDLLSRLAGLIVQGSHSLPGWEQADVVLPGTTYAEGDGTFTNCQGRVQRLAPAIRRRGEALPAWQITTRLAQAWGHAWPYTCAAAILADIAAAIRSYHGLSYAKIGDLGQPIE